MTMWGFDAKSGIFAAAADEREAARRAAASMVGFSIVGSARVQTELGSSARGMRAGGSGARHAMIDAMTADDPGAASFT